MFQSNKGFSLLEVLVAFVVMGLVVGVLLQLFGSSMRSVALADEYSFAIQVAESRLAAVGNEIEVEEGNVSGEEQDSGYRWEVQMSPLEPSEALEKLPVTLQLYRVEVVVTWKSGDSSREFHLSSLRFGEAT
ncbi:MAG: general secretion pathway protein GspI [Thiothrix lacustris]|uniref:General secretion pathway protein GspI n=1 Tax=Thiothrix lacustris TaxID=525917 RepID=A0A1Y1QSQ6_9GAMM|nr:MAG: general secretion pathway protein GspI [Thiothrix lacustris]